MELSCTTTISRPTTSCLNFSTVGCQCSCSSLLTIRALLRKAEYMVEIVSIYPIFDEFDVELGPDELYNVTDYFEWDDQKSGGIYRRMIQRFSRRLVIQQLAFTYELEWIGCTAAQVLTEIIIIIMIEQQLSMLVQGLVKARSDAVDGDSDAAMMALPWLRCQWTNELTTAVVLQMALNRPSHRTSRATRSLPGQVARRLPCPPPRPRAPLRLARGQARPGQGPLGGPQRPGASPAACQGPSAACGRYTGIRPLNAELHLAARPVFARPLRGTHLSSATPAYRIGPRKCVFTYSIEYLG